MTAVAHPSLRPATTKLGGQLRGFGAAQPGRALTGAELGERVGRSAAWIEARTGIQQLRALAGEESIVDLAVRAGADAIRNAGPSTADTDLVIVATCSVRDGAAALAPQIAAALAPTAAVLDLNAACAGFCYSIAAADALIRSGNVSRVLVVGAEHMTGLVDSTEAGTSIIFGDGAGAAVIEAADDGELHIGPVAWGSDGAQADLISVADRTAFMTMAGRKVFRWAIEEIQHVAALACARAAVTSEDIQVFVPHQANARIVDALTAQLALEHAVVARDIVTSGNTSAASIPMALTKLLADGSARSGDLALLVGFGAGLSYAAQVIRLP